MKSDAAKALHGPHSTVVCPFVSCTHNSVLCIHNLCCTFYEHFSKQHTCSVNGPEQCHSTAHMSPPCIIIASITSNAGLCHWNATKDCARPPMVQAGLVGRPPDSVEVGAKGERREHSDMHHASWEPIQVHRLIHPLACWLSEAPHAAISNSVTARLYISCLSVCSHLLQHTLCLVSAANMCLNRSTMVVLTQDVLPDSRTSLFCPTACTYVVHKTPPAAPSLMPQASTRQYLRIIRLF